MLQTYFEHALEQIEDERLKEYIDTPVTIRIKDLAELKRLAITTESIAKYGAEPIEKPTAYGCSFNSEIFMGIEVSVILDAYNKDIDLPYEFKVYINTNSVRVYLFSVHHIKDTLTHEEVIEIGKRVNNYVNGALEDLRYLTSILVKYTKENETSNIEL